MKCLIVMFHMIVFIIGFHQVTFARAPYRVHSSYEDSIRIAIIWNDAQGSGFCQPSLNPVGQKTMEFVLQSLDTTAVRNVKILKNSQNIPTTWPDVAALWGNGLLPHNIIHVNAGWFLGWNGPELDTIFSKAVQNKIGIVSIGDDAADLATNTFGFSGVENVPGPLGDGTNVDSLWIGLLRRNDDHLKMMVNGTTLQYPGLNGIISNAVDSILKGENLPFYAFGEGRCQADADKYNILYPQWITMLGYQQGYDNGGVLNGPNELNVLVAIQDTTNQKLIRRAVALSFQPQFLRNTAAAEQITYDAIMFTSLTHTLSIASTILIEADSDTVKAGEKVNVNAHLFDQNGIAMDEKLPLVKWTIIDGMNVDSLSNATGGVTQFSSTRAWRVLTIRASFYDEENDASVSTTTIIHVMPGDPHHLDISTDSLISGGALNVDGSDVIVNFGKTQKNITVYAFVRDQFQNYIRVASDDVSWSSTDSSVVTASGNNGRRWVGTVVKNDNGSGKIIVGERDLIPDQIAVNVDLSGVLEHSVTRDNNGNGYIDNVELYFDSAITVADYQKAAQQVSLSHGGLTFKVLNVSPSVSSNAVIEFEISEDSSLGLQTDWICNINGTIPIEINENRDLSQIHLTRATSDGVGPVLSRATYKYSGDPHTSDTMILVISEPVHRENFSSILPQDGFVYYSHLQHYQEIELFDNSRFVFDNDNEYINIVKIVLDQSVTRQNTITPFKDLMQFVSGSTDSVGNKPPSKHLSRKVLVETTGRNNITINVYPNPYRVDNLINNLTPDTRDFYKNVIGTSSEGILISIHSQKALIKEGQSFAKIKIYDAVGNLVKKQLNVNMAATSQHYGVVWDAKNEYGRRVGAGMYLLIAVVTDIDNTQFIQRCKIGVSE